MPSSLRRVSGRGSRTYSSAPDRLLARRARSTKSSAASRLAKGSKVFLGLAWPVRQ